jgi:hypothetical protein
MGSNRLNQEIGRYNDLIGEIEKLPSGDECSRLKGIAEQIRTEIIAADVHMQKGKSADRWIERIDKLLEQALIDSSPH